MTDDDLIKIKEIVEKALNQSIESRLKGSLTNSPIGSLHWFNTLLSKIAHIGEYMQKHELTESQRIKWGKILCENSEHLVNNYNLIPFHYLDEGIVFSKEKK